jgi:hypothetical protein
MPLMIRLKIVLPSLKMYQQTFLSNNPILKMSKYRANNTEYKITECN